MSSCGELIKDFKVEDGKMELTLHCPIVRCTATFIRDVTDGAEFEQCILDFVENATANKILKGLV